MCSRRELLVDMRRCTATTIRLSECGEM